jgi:hypothetical protein
MANVGRLEHGVRVAFEAFRNYVNATRAGWEGRLTNGWSQVASGSANRPG